MKTIVETLELQHRALEQEVATLGAEKFDAFGAEWAGVLKLLHARLRDEEKTLHPIHRRLFPG